MPASHFGLVARAEEVLAQAVEGLAQVLHG